MKPAGNPPKSPATSTNAALGEQPSRRFVILPCVSFVATDACLGESTWVLAPLDDQTGASAKSGVPRTSATGIAQGINARLSYGHPCVKHATNGSMSKLLSAPS